MTYASVEYVSDFVTIKIHRPKPRPSTYHTYVTTGQYIETYFAHKTSITNSYVNILREIHLRQSNLQFKQLPRGLLAHRPQPFTAAGC